MFSLCFMCICFLFLCRPMCFNMLESLLLFYKNYHFNECFLILSFILTPCPHSHTPVRILLNVRWQNEAELGRVPCWENAKAENPMGWYFFIFSIYRFLSVLKCLLSMFWEVVKKMEWIYLNQGENVGVSHHYVFALLVSHWFIFQTST